MPKNVIKEKEDFQRYILDYLKNKNGYVVRDAKLVLIAIMQWILNCFFSF